MARKLVEAPRRDWLTLIEVARYLNLSEPTMERLIDAGKFPDGVRLSPKKKMWNWLDVVAYAHLVQRLPALFGFDGEADDG